MAALVAAAATVVAAAPADDHAAGVEAFRRGDVTGAMVPLRRAADAGHAPSQALLAYILDNAGMTQEALPLYRKAAEQGDPDAEAALASLMIEGRALPRDPRGAFRFYARAAGRGHPLAIQAVADAYLRNDAAMLGEDATDVSALAALRRAAETGYLPAVQRLATVYQQGQLGVAADATEAARWQARLAELRARTGAKK